MHVAMLNRTQSSSSTCLTGLELSRNEMSQIRANTSHWRFNPISEKLSQLEHLSRLKQHSLKNGVLNMFTYLSRNHESSRLFDFVYSLGTI